jgi:YVTN family beta-propeller protein
LLGAWPAAGAPTFITFESGHVRLLAVSPDGSRLYAINTPDNRLEVFTVGAGGGLSHSDSIPVGMEPVAVAAPSDDRVWVVNHLSDSVSIIDMTASPARVVRTLLVGDEPRDIVFADGPGGDLSRAFATTARRGQHRTLTCSPSSPACRPPVWSCSPAWCWRSIGWPLCVLGRSPEFA